MDSKKSSSPSRIKIFKTLTLGFLVKSKPIFGIELILGTSLYSTYLINSSIPHVSILIIYNSIRN